MPEGENWDEFVRTVRRLFADIEEGVGDFSVRDGPTDDIVRWVGSKAERLAKVCHDRVGAS